MQREVDMRVVARILLLASLFVVAAAPASAAKPARGCPNEGFVITTKEEFRDLSRELGVPEELLATLDAGWAEYDRNLNTLLCVKDLPDTKGHLDTWVFNVIDDVSNH
jgi:hypothetical protein